MGGKGKPGCKAIEATDWITVINWTNHSLVRLLSKDLDRGEAAAIALAVEIKADLILLDETDARDMAGIYEIRKTGILGILVKAKHRGLIPSLKPHLERLRQDAHFWIKPSLYQRILREVGE